MAKRKQKVDYEAEALAKLDAYVIQLHLEAAQKTAFRAVEKALEEAKGA